MKMLILIGLLVVIGMVYVFMAHRYDRQMESIVRAVLSPPQGAAQDNGLLPEKMRLVAQRAAAALPEGAVAIRIHQKGEMRLGQDKPWKPFKAEQVIALDKVAFAWVASMPLVWGVEFKVVDAYDGKAGILMAHLGRAVPLVTAKGPQYDKGEVQRYLAELPFAPGAVLRNKALRFSLQTDENYLLSTSLQEGDVSIHVALDPQGRISRVWTDSRPRQVGDQLVDTPWQGHFWDWRDVNGYSVPAKGEVSWIIDGELFTYWRGEILFVEALDAEGNTL